MNAHPQRVFAPLDSFGPRGINVHVHEDCFPGTVLLFVPGFGGHGYSTWKGLPAAVFDSDTTERCDVAVFHYRSGFRALTRGQRGADLRFHIDQLAGILRDLSELYDEIVIVAHSLGGIVSSAAIRQLLDEIAHSSHAEALTPVAALIMFASPRAGSWWARPYLTWLFREFVWLKAFSPHAHEVSRFFETYVEGHAVADPGNRKYLVPQYTCAGSRDRIVEYFSATFGIPAKQTFLLNKTHTSIVKPGKEDQTLPSWLEGIFSDTKKNREQYRRYQKQRQRYSNPVTELYIDKPKVITELWTTTDSDSFEWKQIYNQVRAVVEHDLQVDVFDLRDGYNTEDVDILISVLKVSEVIAESKSGPCHDAVTEACARHSGSSRLQVGIVVVGHDHISATAQINGWVVLKGPSSSFYIQGASDADSLRELLYRQIRPVVEQRLQRNPQQSVEPVHRASYPRVEEK